MLEAIADKMKNILNSSAENMFLLNVFTARGCDFIVKFTTDECTW